MARYNEEGYLNNTVGQHPWITVSIGNHLTYLRDFNVRISDKKLRDDVVELALKQLTKRIKQLEEELKKLVKKIK